MTWQQIEILKCNGYFGCVKLKLINFLDLCFFFSSQEIKSLFFFFGYDYDYYLVFEDFEIKYCKIDF